MLDEKKLVTARKSSGKTQLEMAEAMGISTRTYQRYESGQTKIKYMPMITTIAGIIGVMPESLLTENDIQGNPAALNAARHANVEREIDQLVNVILEQNGPQHQAVILIEEMSELTKVLCKIQRGKFQRGKLNEEFAHVQVSCEVIRRIMQIQDSDIADQVKAKLAEYLA